MTVLRVLDSYSPRNRDSATVLVLVEQGEPRIGMVFNDVESGGKCKITGVGGISSAATKQSERTLTLQFANVEGTCRYREGQLLTENEYCSLGRVALPES